MVRVKRISSSWKLIYIVGLFMAIILGLRLIWLKPYEIPSPSMAPTLLPGDCILVNKLAYLSRTALRGDIVVFKYPMDPERVFIKRVIAVEGEDFEIKDSQVYINNKPLSEPYINKVNFAAFSSRRVPSGFLLVLGDNRNESRDSREWGMLPRDNLLGRAMFIYSPSHRFSILR
ncbi:MAG TPA: signal peptidase I [Candidatus Deferrimicrobium sp.]|nr:signal peptidase I [Candidatus Deferrimicrobium sp.]